MNKIKLTIILFLFFHFHFSFAQLPYKKIKSNLYQLILPPEISNQGLFVKKEIVKKYSREILFQNSNEEDFENITEKLIIQVDTFFGGRSENAKISQTFENAYKKGEKDFKNIFYFLSFSPDHKKALLYYYNFDRANELMSATLLIPDDNLKSFTKSKLTLENGIVNYGLYIGNDGKIISINTINNSGIYLKRFDPVSRQSEFLSIEESNLKRRDVKIFQSKNDEIFLCNLCEDESGKLIGLMYSKFNFKVNKVEKIIFHRFTNDIASKLIQNQADGFFYINEFTVGNTAEEIKIVLQRKKIISSNYVLHPYQTLFEAPAEVRKQRKLELEKLCVEIYKEGKLVREEFLK